MIRDDIKAATITAMKGGDKDTVSTLRLVQSADQEPRYRGSHRRRARRRRRARHRSAAEDDQAAPRIGRGLPQEQARGPRRRRRGEIAVIERFLPAQLSEEEAQAKIREIIAETGAASMKDMGRVMALVKERLGTSIEPARASALVKSTLA